MPRGSPKRQAVMRSCGRAGQDLRPKYTCKDWPWVLGEPRSQGRFKSRSELSGLMTLMTEQATFEAVGYSRMLSEEVKQASFGS